MSAAPAAPEGLRELVDSLGLEPLRPLLRDLAAELAGFVASPPEAPEELAAQAHGLIGAAGGLGFDSLAAACRRLERACQEGRDSAAPLRAAQGSAEEARGAIEALVKG